MIVSKKITHENKQFLKLEIIWTIWKQKYMYNYSIKLKLFALILSSSVHITNTH